MSPSTSSRRQWRIGSVAKPTCPKTRRCSWQKTERRTTAEDAGRSAERGFLTRHATYNQKKDSYFSEAYGWKDLAGQLHLVGPEVCHELRIFAATPPCGHPQRQCQQPPSRPTVTSPELGHGLRTRAHPDDRCRILDRRRRPGGTPAEMKV